MSHKPLSGAVQNRSRVIPIASEAQHRHARLEAGNSSSDTPSLSWQDRLRLREQSGLEHLWALLDQVKDPEIPALSLWDLGVLRAIELEQPNKVRVTITPTYCGCPAIQTMSDDIINTLTQAGYTPEIHTTLSPAWSTQALSDTARASLKHYGIAAPISSITDSNETEAMTPAHGVPCPHCDSTDTECISEFGSTACKALFKCHECLEPFDYFKAL